MDEQESSKNKSLQVYTIFFLGGNSYDQSGSKIKYKKKIRKIKKSTKDYEHIPGLLMSFFMLLYI